MLRPIRNSMASIADLASRKIADAEHRIARLTGVQVLACGAYAPPQVVTKEKAPKIMTPISEPIRPIEPKSKMTPISEPIRPIAHYSFNTPEGKRESVPVITRYYPNQIVGPLATTDRHLDPKLMRAASIAEERAHAHSRSMCWHYVKEALLASGVIDSRPKSELARDAAQDLVANYGFKKLSVRDPFAAPIGSVLVYGTSRSVGHVEIRTKDGVVSDFRSPTPSKMAWTRGAAVMTRRRHRKVPMF